MVGEHAPGHGREPAEHVAVYADREGKLEHGDGFNVVIQPVWEWCHGNGQATADRRTRTKENQG